MVDFNDPAWRSPATGSTKSEILAMRAVHRNICKRVNIVLVARYRVDFEIRKMELADAAELERLEQEERDNAEPLRKRTAR